MSFGVAEGENLFAFTQRVCRLGYRLVPEFCRAADSEPFITENAPGFPEDDAPEQDFQEYREAFLHLPPSHFDERAGLFRAFSRVTTSERALAFANQSGLLGLMVAGKREDSRLSQSPRAPRSRITRVASEVGTLRFWEEDVESEGEESPGVAWEEYQEDLEICRLQPRQSAERLSVWLEEAAILRTLIDLWELSEPESGRWTELENRVRIENSTLVLDNTRHFVGKALDKSRALKEHVRRTTDFRIKRLTQVGVIWESQDRARVRFGVSPTCLLGELWVQFAKWIEGGVSLVRCANPQCSREPWFRPNRLDSKFCSSGCRDKSRRQREREAVGLLRSGTPIKVVAEEVGSSDQAIRRLAKSLSSRPPGRPKRKST